MNIGNFSLRRSSKFLLLLLTSLLIGAANAAIFYSLTMQPEVSITGANVCFVSGDDLPSGSSLGDNSTWVSLALKAYPNITLTYEEPLNISNTDASGHDFRLRYVSIAPASGQPQVGNFSFINFVVLNAAGVAQGSFNFTTTGTTWNTPATTSWMTLPAGTQWVIYIETKATASANDVTASMVITVDVQ